jgi:hypothetical protein
MNREATIKADNNIKIRSLREPISGDDYDKYVISRRTIVAYLDKIYNLGLNDLSEKEEQRGDLKRD